MNLTGGKVVPSPGGVFIKRDGVRVGSVGVSADLPDRNEACAVVGIEAAGLTAQI